MKNDKSVRKLLSNLTDDDIRHALDDLKKEGSLSEDARTEIDRQREIILNKYLAEEQQKHLSRTSSFIGGLIGGSLTELLSPQYLQNSNILNLTETLAIAGIGFPVFNHFFRKESWTTSYKRAPYIAAGYMLGQTLVKYLKP